MSYAPGDSGKTCPSCGRMGCFIVEETEGKQYLVCQCGEFLGEAPKKLVECMRCLKHTNPISAKEFIKAYPEQLVRLAMRYPDPATLVCEYCGWKVRT